MLIDEILARKGISKYRLAKASGLPHTTINDICSGKTRLDKSSAETVYKLAKGLNVSMDQLLENFWVAENQPIFRSSFAAFKSNVCHQVKDMGDLNFLAAVLKTDKIRNYFDKQWFPESLYLLAMVDFLSRENALPLSSAYQDIRACKLAEPIFPSSVLAAAAALNNNRWKLESLKHSIPEFKRFNIVENEVRNVI